VSPELIVLTLVVFFNYSTKIAGSSWSWW